MKLFAAGGVIAALILGYLAMPPAPIPTLDIRGTATRVAFNRGAMPNATPTATAGGTPEATPTLVQTRTPAAKSVPSATATLETANKAAPSATRTTSVAATGAASQATVLKDATPLPARTATPAVTSTPELVALVPAKRAFNHNYVIKEDYDQAKDQTTFSLEERLPDLTAVPNSLYVTYNVPGTQRAIPSAVAVSFFSRSTSWQFLLTQDANVRLDGVTYLNWRVTERGAAGGESVTELLTANVRVKDFLMLVNSTTVEVQIGPYYFELTSEQMEALRDLASRMAP